MFNRSGALIAISLVSLIATAKHVNAEFSQDRLNYCEDWRQFSELQMKMRQDGFPYTKAISLIKEAASEGKISKNEFKFMLDISMAAYGRELEHSYRLADVAVIKFGEYIFYICMSER
jgi:hypothetical protein